MAYLKYQKHFLFQTTENSLYTVILLLISMICSEKHIVM